MLLQLLQQAFTRMPYLKQVLLVSDLDFDADIQKQQQQRQQTHALTLPDTAATLFAKSARVSNTGPWLYECSRQLALPPLQVKGCISIAHRMVPARCMPLPQPP